MAWAKIKIYKRKTVLKDGRQEETDPELFFSPWCKVKSLYGQELYGAINVNKRNTLIFETRYCRKIEELEQELKEFFVEFRGKRYELYATDCRANDHQYIQLKANRND